MALFMSFPLVTRQVRELVDLRPGLVTLTAGAKCGNVVHVTFARQCAAYRNTIFSMLW